MKIETLMTKRVVTIKMDDSLRVARDIFDRTKFHHLLVVESDVLYGVLSDRDLLKAVSPYVGTISETVRDAATLNKKAHQVMTRKPITLTIDNDFVDVIEVFKNHSVSCVPIVDEEDHPVGIISWRDVLKAL